MKELIRESKSCWERAARKLTEGFCLFTLLIILGWGLLVPVSAGESEEINELFNMTIEELLSIKVGVTRRDINSQDVSVSVSTITNEQLIQMGTVNTLDLERVSPGLNIQAGAFAVSSLQISIRGVGNNFFDGNAVATVGMYLDQVYLNSVVGHGLHLFDLKRVEVLRGPQGTFYGGSATGGAINLIAEKPVTALMLTSI